MLNHFFWSRPTVPSFVSDLMTLSIVDVSFEPFCKTAPYCSCVTIWPATGPNAPGFDFASSETSGTSRMTAWHWFSCAD